MRRPAAHLPVAAAVVPPRETGAGLLVLSGNHHSQRLSLRCQGVCGGGSELQNLGAVGAALPTGEAIRLACRIHQPDSRQVGQGA